MNQVPETTIYSLPLPFMSLLLRAELIGSTWLALRLLPLGHLDATLEDSP